MAFKSLNDFINALDKAGELYRIKDFVDPVLEIAEITDRISKTPNRNKAIFFENTGTEFPLLINGMGSEKRISMALGVEKIDAITNEIENLFKELTAPKKGFLEKLSMLPQLSKFASWMPTVISGKGACQEIVMNEPDLNKLPILKCWQHDGGKFITLPAVHTKNPINGVRNIGMYRMQVFTPTMTGMHWHKHKDSAHHYNLYKQLNKKMPVAVALGGDPVFTYIASAPLPENVDEYMLAGFLRKKKVQLVRCITQSEIEVPADADFIIEGYVDPNEELIWEGPFGDHTGFYSLPDWYPRFHVTAITHKKNAIYPTTIVGIPPQEDVWIGKATERIFLAPIKISMLPEITDMNMPVEGVFHNIVIAAFNKDFAGQGQKVMNSLWGAGQMMFNKILILTDSFKKCGIEINNYAQIAKYILDNVNTKTDIYFSKGPMDVLDHSCSKMGFGGKMCIDGSKKTEEETSESFQQQFVLSPQFSVNKIISQYPSITGINILPAQKLQIPILLIGVNKNIQPDIKYLHTQLCELPEMIGIKIILYAESTVNINNIADIVWRSCNNIDPSRDNFFAGKNSDILGLDGTRKTLKIDNFNRPWPNIIVADKNTIASVDNKWGSFGIGEKIPSPSLRYYSQLYEGEATVTNND